MRQLLLVLPLALGLAVAHPTASHAAWSQAGSSSASATATRVLKAGAPTATGVLLAVRIDWPQTTLAQGTAATGYVVKRHTGTTSSLVCTTTEPTRTCTDTAPLSTSAFYSVTATYGPWTGPESDRTPFSLDQTPPAAPTGLRISDDTGASSTDAITRVAAQSLLGSAEANASIEVRVDGVVVGTSQATSGGTFSVPMGALAEGQRSVTAVAVDAAGNRSAASTALVVKVDVRAPGVVIAFPVNGATYKTGAGGFKNGCLPNQYNVCGTASDASYSAGLDKVRVKLANAGGACFVSDGVYTTAACIAPPTATGTTAWRLYVGSPPISSYTLTVTGTDLAGNAKALTITFNRT